MQKILVSLRLDSVSLDKADTLGIAEDRSRNYIINILLNTMIKNMERRNGEIKVNTAQLEKFRRKRHSHNRKPTKSGADKS